MPQLTRITFTGALVLASIQAACVETDLTPEEIGAVEQAVGSGSGTSGSGSTCDPAPTSPCVQSCGRSCAPIPAPAQGRYPAPKTSGWATTTYTYRLRATKYSVTWAGGWHTGVGFTASSKTDSERFWCEDTNGDGVGDTTKSQRATSTPTQEVWDSKNHNHGRTVLDDLAHSTVNTTVEFTTGGKQPAAYKEAMLMCIGLAERDGFCDRLCGNDAYTVPNIAKNDNDDPHPTDPMPFTNRMNYGVSPTSDPARWSHLRDLTVWPIPHYRVPRYGHNSNNDANAQNAMMAQCNGFRVWLDSAYDTLVSPNAQCGTDWGAIGTQLDSRIRAVCNAQCGGVRMFNYPATPTGDTCIAASDSSLSGFNGSSIQPQPDAVKCMEAGNYLQGAWPHWVCGM